MFSGIETWGPVLELVQARAEVVSDISCVYARVDKRDKRVILEWNEFRRQWMANQIAVFKIEYLLLVLSL